MSKFVLRFVLPFAVSVGICLSFDTIANADDGESVSSFKFVPSVKLRFSSSIANKGIPQGSKLESFAQTAKPKAKYYWFRYGDASSWAVGIMFDPDEPEKLRIDIDRDQSFSESEVFVSANEERWQVSLSAEYGVQQSKTSTQEIQISRNKSDGSLSVATAGVRKGKANFRGEFRDAIIEDRNANGLWFDAEDRLFVDFDGNGKISRMRERVPCYGIRNIRGELYAIAGSAAGESVSLRQVTETGTLIPTLTVVDDSATITSISAQLGSSTGIGVSVDAIDKPLEVPIGDWHVQSIKVEVKAGDGVFQFAFARMGTKELVSISENEEKHLELLGALELSGGVSTQYENGKAYLTINPVLTTESDCYLVGSKTGKQSAVSENRLNAFSRDLQRDLDVGSSGFS